MDSHVKFSRASDTNAFHEGNGEVNLSTNYELFVFFFFESCIHRSKVQ